MAKTSKQSATNSKRKPQASGTTALSDAQLDAVSGGSLYQSCATGTHIPSPVIVVR